MADQTLPMAGMTALVTGSGGGGLGAASGLEMARSGATVAIMGRTEETLEAARQEILDEIPRARIEVVIGGGSSESDVCAALLKTYDWKDGLTSLSR